MREMTAPGVWVDRGPRSATTSARRYSSVPALQVGSMLPLAASGPALVSDAELARRARRTARARADFHPTERARCGVMLKWIREPCGRRPGHKHDHKSAASVEAGNARRRSAGRIR